MQALRLTLRGMLRILNEEAISPQEEVDLSRSNGRKLLLLRPYTEESTLELANLNYVSQTQ